MLAGIFEKVLSRNRKLNLVNERISKSPELKDQQVTQFVIHDGWIGIALGPKLPSRTACRRKSPPGRRSSPHYIYRLTSIRLNLSSPEPASVLDCCRVGKGHPDTAFRGPIFDPHGTSHRRKSLGNKDFVRDTSMQADP